MPTFSVPRRSVAVSVAAALVGVSTAVLLSAAGAPAARAAAAPGSTIRASVVDGTNAESDLGAYQQELSANGNAVVFTSSAQLDDLATAPPGVSNYENVYVRDLGTNRTVLISRGQFTRPPIIDLRGQRLLALNGRAAAQDVHLGEVPPNQDSYQPTISADGRYVAFVTTATNIVTSDADNDQDIIVCDRDPDGDGVFDEDKANGERDYRYVRVTSGQTGGGPSPSPARIDWPRWPKLSDDGSRIVWLDRTAVNDYYHWNRVRTATLSTSPGTTAAVPGGGGWLTTPLPNEELEDQADPDISGDGRYVVLKARHRTPTDDPYDDEPAHHSIFRVDLMTGAIARVDLAQDGSPISDREEVFVEEPVISRDGGVIAFDAEYKQRDPCEGTCWIGRGQPNVFVVRVTPAGAVTGSEIVSRDNFGEPVNGFAPGLSADGRFVSFVTDNYFVHDGVDATDGETCLEVGEEQPADTPLPPPSADRDVRTRCQVVLRDLVVDRTRAEASESRLPGALASPGTGRACAEDVAEGSTCGGNANTTPLDTEKSPTLSATGTRIAYESAATDLVPDADDRNDAQDVFVRTFQPELRVAPDQLDFGEVVVEETATATVRFNHVGIGPLAVESVEIEGAEFTVTDQTCVHEGAELHQGGYCLVEIEFAPVAESAFDGLLRVRLPRDRAVTVRLVGVGVPKPVDPVPTPARFAAGPDPVAFGERLIRAPGVDRTVTVTNQGEAALTVNQVVVEPVAARPHYTVVGNTCDDAPLAAGASCAVTVRFVPTASGDLPAALSFVDDAAGSPHLVGLTGNAPTPTISVSPAVSPPGRVVTVTGTQFAPNQRVETVLPLAVQTGPVTVAADGTFRAAVLILPKAAIGTRTVITRLTTFPEINAEAQLLVVTPTVGPAEFVVRG